MAESDGSHAAPAEVEHLSDEQLEDVVGGFPVIGIPGRLTVGATITAGAVTGEDAGVPGHVETDPADHYPPRAPA